MPTTPRTASPTNERTRNDGWENELGELAYRQRCGGGDADDDW